MSAQTWATETEIAAQPDIWEAWSHILPGIAADIAAWVTARKPDVIWLTGAGTSAFIGDALAVFLDARLQGIPVRAVASTDLVARPGDYLKPGLRPLVVSFGRSGDSSETIGTLDLLDRTCPAADRLNITCNATSALATRDHPGPGTQKVIVLPDACHDQGFAMTSSYTTMLLTALACLSGAKADEISGNLGTLATAARDVLQSVPDLPCPARAVFLGSGPFLGTARESALKVLELTAGQVVTAWDSTLGFRHGPKAITDDQTTVFVFLSSDPLSRKYDDDIVAELRSQFPATRTVSIGDPAAGATPDLSLPNGLPDVWNTALYVLVAQVLSVAWSKSLNLNVDNPFEGGNLSRVVSHVRLYV
ncbi:SIS domain-containing protein [Ruegeria sp.]|uniref:SIS domain-containing protein n=1 Tax=Ruegeria sp. TaxID=1879320 RepID=UPI00231E4D9C|nr:SIS domain-containing protein [Ruegeria sp.]MDA7963477.1 SIS domain-containing protein [Ruegeria sp.]